MLHSFIATLYFLLDLLGSILLHLIIFQKKTASTKKDSAKNQIQEKSDIKPFEQNGNKNVEKNTLEAPIIETTPATPATPRKPDDANKEQEETETTERRSSLVVTDTVVNELHEIEEEKHLKSGRKSVAEEYIKSKNDRDQEMMQAIQNQATEMSLTHRKMVLLPHKLRYAKSLVKLDLSHNNLTSLPIWFFKNLPNLKHLNLSHNLFFELNGSFSQLKLSYINLSNNRFEYFPKPLLDMKELEELHIHHNVLMALPSEINKLENLKVLDVSNNALMNLPEQISGLKKLKVLKISNNKFISSIREILDRFKSNSELQTDYYKQTSESESESESDSEISSPKKSLETSRPSPRSKIPESPKTDQVLVDKYKTKRVNALLELLKSEKKYYRYLQVLYNQYFCPLTGRQPNEPVFLNYSEDIIPQSVGRKLFPPNLVAIINLSKQLEKDLEANIPTESADKIYESKVGKVFIDAAPYFKIYTNYISLYNQSHANLIAAKKNYPKFMEQIIIAGRQISGADGLELESLLVMPIQRIPRYSMLVKAVLKYTSETHEDYEDLKNAIDLIDKVAVYVDEEIAYAINRMKVKSIQQEYDIINLVQPSRVFVKEGELRTTEKTYYAYLFNDAILLKEISGVVGTVSHYLNLGNVFGTVTLYEFKNATVEPLGKERVDGKVEYKFNLYLDSFGTKFGFIANTDWASELLKLKGVTKRQPHAHRRLTISIKDLPPASQQKKEENKVEETNLKE